MSRSLTPPANTLLEGSTSRGTSESAVYDVLDLPDETNLLVLSYRDGPDSWFGKWRSVVGDLPDEVGFVHVGVKTRSSAVGRAPAARSEFGVAPDPVLLADAVEDPTDLARLGVSASEYLESWDGNGNQTVVYLDSLTAMLEHVDLDRAFRFLHVLAGRVESVDGRGYYLLDPTAHDDRSLVVVRDFADAVVDLDRSDSP